MKTINIDTVGRGIQNAYDRGNYAIEHMPPELKPPLHCVAIFDIGDLGFLYMPSMHHIVFKQYPVLDEAMQKNVQADVALMGKAGKCELVTILRLERLLSRVSWFIWSTTNPSGAPTMALCRRMLFLCPEPPPLRA